jgi:hypothetical protein
MAYAGLSLHRTKRQHADLLGLISKLQADNSITADDPLDLRVKHQFSQIEGRITALFIVGIVNLLMVSSCFTAFKKKADSMDQPNS